MTACRAMLRHMGKSVTRLYEQFQPSKYDLTLTVDDSAMRFSGSVVIKGKKVGRPTQRITLHQHDLRIVSAKITKHDKQGDQELIVKRINNHDTLNEVRLHTEASLYPGAYTLELAFEAPITDGMTGIYPCYFKEGAVSKKLIATQFESHHAREAFPCIDEPEAKAVFNLSLVTRKDAKVLANTPIVSEAEVDEPTFISSSKKSATQPNTKYKLTTFETTPHMSSYLLAFAMGDIHHKTTKTGRGTDVSIWATTAHPADSLDFALDVAKRSIEFFEEYFGVPYPLSKCDHVALPDFSVGAMENWGLITYRERLLVAYPGEASQSTLEQIALVIAHETSHQWFGNLVTMQWWDDLWLNESFANMMEYQAVDAMFPEWQVWNAFAASEGLSALRRDAIAGVQAVKTAVHHPDEISSLFDPSIVYAKGGRLLYMLKNYIGEEAFRAGLKAYFEDHAYSNTTGADLWKNLSDSSGKDIGAFMEPWLTRSGFPVVAVTQDGDKATLEQTQFLMDPKKIDNERLWPVPLFADTAEQTEALHERTCVLHLPSTDTLLLNTHARGHYITRYVTDHQKSVITDMVRKQAMSEPDRLMLLNGSSMLARAGYEPFSNVLSMLRAYERESSEPVWDIMAMTLGEARRFIDLDESLEDSVKPFISELVAAQVDRLGWDATAHESAADTKLRALVLGLSTYAEDADTVKHAIDLFSAYQNTNAPLPAELRPLIFTIPIKQGDAEAFDFLLALHDSTQNGDLKADAADALTATRDTQQAARLLARLQDAELVKPQDVDRWLVYLLRNRYTRATAWDWLVTNWQWLEDTFSRDKTYDYLPRYAASCVNTREYQKKFRDLFESKQDQLLLKRNIELGFEEIETRVTWLERDLQGVQRFFGSK